MSDRSAHRRNREDIVAAGSAKPRTQVGLIAVRTVTRYRRRADLPPRRALEQLNPESGLDWTWSGIFAFCRRLGSWHQSLGRYRARPNGTGPGCRPRGPTPRVDSCDLAQRPRVLTFEPRRVVAVLRQPRCLSSNSTPQPRPPPAPAQRPPTTAARPPPPGSHGVSTRNCCNDCQSAAPHATARQRVQWSARPLLGQLP